MNVHCSSRISGIAAGLLLALAAIPASAHHSAALFDMSKQVSVHGTVEKWIWGNPHCWLFVLAVKPDGSQQVWAFEGGSTGMLARAGLNYDDLKVGDQVAVTAAPERNGTRYGLLDKVQLPTGRVVVTALGAPPGAPKAPASH